MKHTQTLIAHWRKSPFLEDEEYVLCQADMSKYGIGYVVIGPIEVEYETPDNFNPVVAELETLKQRENDLRREFVANISQVQGRISELTAIEFTGVAA